MNWQPIETAPKDMYILLALESGAVVEGSWRDGSEFGDPIGWYMAGCHPADPFKSGKGMDATHWMPLPEPPK